MKSAKLRLGLGFASLWILTAGQVATAQEPFYTVRGKNEAASSSKSSDQDSAKETRIVVELLTGKQGVGLSAQEWRKVFEPLGVSLRIRRAVLEEDPEIEERTYRTLRLVNITGRLDRRGRLVFPGRTFSRSQIDELAEWIRNVKTYGAQGSPEGQPAWGLNKQQFEEFFNVLSERLSQQVQDVDPETALEKLQLPEKYPVRFQSSARSVWKRKSSSPVRQELKGLSKGSALAILLAEKGLGFQPLRTPEGTIEISVSALKDTPNPWPVGWPVDESPRKLVPKLFKLVPVELQEAPLEDVIEAISVTAEVPIYFDYHSIEAKGIDVSERKVSYPSRHASYSQVLKGITVPAMLKHEILVDERGQPFAWIGVLKPKRSEEDSPRFRTLD